MQTAVRRMVLPSKRQVKRNPRASWCECEPCSRAQRAETAPLSAPAHKRCGSAPGLFLTWLSSSSSRAGSALCCFFVCVVMAIPPRAPMQACLASPVFQQPDWFSERPGFKPWQPRVHLCSSGLNCELWLGAGRNKRDSVFFFVSCSRELCSSLFSLLFEQFVEGVKGDKI